MKLNALQFRYKSNIYELVVWGGADRQIHRHTDISTYRLDWRRSGLSEKIKSKNTNAILCLFLNTNIISQQSLDLPSLGILSNFLSFRSHLRRAAIALQCFCARLVFYMNHNSCGTDAYIFQCFQLETLQFLLPI